MRRHLLEILRNLLDDGEPGIAVIHSSLASLGAARALTKWDFVYALEGLAREGWTLALPAFTFSFCRTGRYHFRDSRSETGVLADWLLEGHRASIRTAHPIYSFAVAGPAAGEIAACQSSTTFGDDSPFALFERRDAAILMLGCDWKYATQLHRAEELAGVPYRFFKDFTGRADYGASERDATARMFVRDLAVNPLNDFSPAIAQLRAEGRIAARPLGRGLVERARAADLTRVARGMLDENPLAFVADPSLVARRLAAAAQPPLRIAVLGGTNVVRLRTSLEAGLAGLLPDRRIETHEVPYGQLPQQLIDPGSQLRAWKPDISIFFDRLEDLAGAPADLDGAVARHASALAAWHGESGGWTLVHRFAPQSPAWETSGAPSASDRSARANEILRGALQHLPQIAWIDTQAEAAACPAPAADARLWQLARFPCSDAFAQQLAGRWAAKIVAILGRGARALVLDLDNTLWGGVLGEDGLSGVRLGGDFPGNAYLAFQRALRSLRDRGVALAVCSKNDPDLALQAIDALPDMQFRGVDLASHRIGWRPKHETIREIAAELNLGLDSLLFIDDNPLEREQMRLNNPAVRILDLPADPSGYADALVASPWLEIAALTDEDRRRADGYRARRLVEQQRAGAASLEEFYASLGMKLHFQPLDAGNAARAAQLCMKTNQFNTATRRYDQSDLRKIVETGGEVIVLGLEDRFSARENIGLLILLPRDGAAHIDNYLLSCRVLGRGLETAVLAWARRHAEKAGHPWTVGEIIETERNTPARGVFRDAGFTPGGKPGQWIAPSGNAPDLPAWLEIADHTA